MTERLVHTEDKANQRKRVNLYYTTLSLSHLPVP